MKLLHKFQHASDAEEVAADLEQRGIPTYVSSAQSSRLSGALTGALSSELYILIPDQLSEAKSALSDPNYEVQSPYSADDVIRIKAEMRAAAWHQLSPWAFGTLAALMTTIIVVLVSFYG